MEATPLRTKGGSPHLDSAGSTIAAGYCDSLPEGDDHSWRPAPAQQEHSIFHAACGGLLTPCCRSPSAQAYTPTPTTGAAAKPTCRTRQVRALPAVGSARARGLLQKLPNTRCLRQQGQLAGSSRGGGATPVAAGAQRRRPCAPSLQRAPSHGHVSLHPSRVRLQHTHRHDRQHEHAAAGGARAGQPAGGDRAALWRPPLPRPALVRWGSCWAAFGQVHSKGERGLGCVEACPCCCSSGCGAGRLLHRLCALVLAVDARAPPLQ